MKKNGRLLAGALMVVGVLAALWPWARPQVGRWLLEREFHKEDAAAIGIIGGADGPTAIYVAGLVAPQLVDCLWLVGGITIAGCGLWRWKKK